MAWRWARRPRCWSRRPASPRGRRRCRARRAARTPTGRGRAATSGSTPQTPATWARAAGSSISAVAGQLVGLLPVLATALAVALAGEAAVAGARLADHAERQGDVDPGEDGVGAGGVLLGAAGGQDHDLRRRGRAVAASARTSDAVDPGHPLDPLGPPGGDRVPDLVPAGGPRREVVLVDRARRRPAGAAPRAPARGRCPAPAGATRSARSAVGVRRGSMTTTRPPRARSRSRCRAAGGIVSARLDPTSTSTSVSSTSASGKGRPRSRPKARMPADAADDMHQRPL